MKTSDLEKTLEVTQVKVLEKLRYPKPQSG